MNGNVSISFSLQADSVSSAAREAAAWTAWLPVELPILACGNDHKPATTQPVITQIIPLCEWSHTPISERRCLDSTVNAAQRCVFLAELAPSG